MRRYSQELQKRCNAAEALSTNGDASIAGLQEFNSSARNEHVSGSHSVTENPLFREVWHCCALLVPLWDAVPSPDHIRAGQIIQCHCPQDGSPAKPMQLQAADDLAGGIAHLKELLTAAQDERDRAREQLKRWAVWLLYKTLDPVSPSKRGNE